MSEVGALIVKLTAETAQFREDMGKVKSQLDDLKDGGKGAGEAIGNMGSEARGGLMLIEDAVGVRLPRHLNALIAQIPGVGALFAFMLPIAGVAVAIKIVGELIEKHSELQKAIRAAAEESVNQTVKEADQTHALELTNLKLDDQIAKLEHKPSHNYMKEAILETAMEVDKLASSFASDFAKMDEAIVHQLDWWTELKSAAKDSLSVGVAWAVGFAAVQDKVLTAVQVKMGEVEDKRRQLAEAPLSSKGGAEDELLNSLTAQQKAIDAAIPAFGDNAAMMLKLKSAAASTASEIKDLNLEMDAGSKKKTIAGLEQGNANLETLRNEAALEKLAASGVDQHSQALIKLAHTMHETSDAAGKGGEDNTTDQKLAKQKDAIEEERQSSVDAVDAELKAKQAYYNADIKAAGNDVQKRKELDAGWANTVQANTDAVVGFNATAAKQIVAADRDAANQRLAIAKSFHSAIDKAAQDGATQEAQLTLKAQEQAAKNELALHHGTAQQIAALEVENNKAEEQLELTAINTRQKNLDTADKNYLKSWVEFEAEKLKVTQKAEAEQDAITAASMQKQLMDIQQAENKMKEAIASNVANSIVMNKSLAASFEKTGEQMAEQLIKNLLMQEMTGDRSKSIDASVAAAHSFDWASAWGGPVAGYAAAAVAYAGVMSFEQGGKIPGDGAVPIEGHGGETVITKALTDRVESAERGGNSGASHHTWNFAPQIHAVDATGVDAMLTKHASLFQRHVNAAVRKMGK